MLLTFLIFIPVTGLFATCANLHNEFILTKQMKFTALIITLVNLFFSLIMFIFFDFSDNIFQFVPVYDKFKYFDLFLGIDGLSNYFVLLTTIIIPISLLCHWISISLNIISYLTISLLLQTLLLVVFLILDIFLFYIFFESILPPLFIFIGLFGSNNKSRAAFYLFLYTLFGSLFLLLSILTASSMMGATDLDAIYKIRLSYFSQLFILIGICISFAIKTPVIFVNSWLLKAHVESPLGGSLILAAIVLKLSLYGIFRLILSILPVATINYIYLVYLVLVITILYASLSTLRTIDIKELVAYSSVCHASVYVLGVFSNTIQGIEGGIVLGLAHGIVSSGLFICTGGVLYDRTHTRLINFYKGIAQIMPVFSIMFFILCLANAGTPLTFNFVGEFLSLYGTFERLPVMGAIGSSSIVFSAAYSMFMFNRIAFGGALSNYIQNSFPDLIRREFFVLLPLVVFTILLGIYPAPILDGLHYSVSTLIYSSDLASSLSLSLAPTFRSYYNNAGFINNLIMKRSFSSTSSLLINGNSSNGNNGNGNNGNISEKFDKEYVKFVNRENLSTARADELHSTYDDNQGSFDSYVEKQVNTVNNDAQNLSKNVDEEFEKGNLDKQQSESYKKEIESVRKDRLEEIKETKDNMYDSNDWEPRPFQDSSHLDSSTEPFDFGGGDD